MTSQLASTTMGRYNCLNCSKIFSCLAGLQRHIRSLQSLVRLICTICQKAYKRQDGFKNYVKRNGYISEEIPTIATTSCTSDMADGLSTSNIRVTHPDTQDATGSKHISLAEDLYLTPLVNVPGMPIPMPSRAVNIFLKSPPYSPA